MGGRQVFWAWVRASVTASLAVMLALAFASSGSSPAPAPARCRDAIGLHPPAAPTSPTAIEYRIRQIFRRVIGARRCLLPEAQRCTRLLVRRPAAPSLAAAVSVPLEPLTPLRI